MLPPPLLVLAGGCGGCTGGVSDVASGSRAGSCANAASNAVESCWLNGEDEELSSDDGLVLAAVEYSSCGGGDDRSKSCSLRLLIFAREMTSYASSKGTLA